MTHQSTIAETPNFIVIDRPAAPALACEPPTGYQSEAGLESELIADLQALGYEYLPGVSGPGELMANARRRLQALNGVEFTDAEWRRFAAEYLDSPGDGMADCTAKVQKNHVHDFTFDDGRLRNIRIADKEQPARNSVQVVRQFRQAGAAANRYDVTILVNGLPMVQVELKRRGVAIREAFNQVRRYGRESFNARGSLYKYLQIFVVSNGTDTRYFANTADRGKGGFDFTMNWAGADNTPIRDLKDFTATFFQKNTLLRILLTYSVLDSRGNLLIMRPYQIAAAERIVWKIKAAHQAGLWSRPEGGGYVWHTTGSGKTLTSFKAARLATGLGFIDKVFFVVDRKDLDYQTMVEYERYSPGCANGSENTARLKENIARRDGKIIVTTIQKLNNLMKSEPALPVYRQHVVFIFDECHRSQFGQAQQNIRRKFAHHYRFGFTGTPIFPENAIGAETTAGVFGRELHSYVITDAIRDGKVLKFKVDYNNVKPMFRKAEADGAEADSEENRRLLHHPGRIDKVARHVMGKFRIKTHRNVAGGKGFNAMFAVDSVKAAKLYYEAIGRLQQGADTPLRVATIFSFAPNGEQRAMGEIAEEGFEPGAMAAGDKEFLAKAMGDYNAAFRTNFGMDGGGFQNYYRDLAKRVKDGEVDLLIVVGMFLTGFDAPRLNTLFVDKNLRYHGLLQAFSRTNRIYGDTKTFGNIVAFRDMEQATIDAITLFGDKGTRNVIIEKSYKEQMGGFTDTLTGEARRGYAEIVAELKRQFPRPGEIDTTAGRKTFVKLFGEYLKAENILQNYDEFALLKAYHAMDKAPGAVEAFKRENMLTGADIAAMEDIGVLTEREVQDYRSAYNDIRDWARLQRQGSEPEENKADWDGVVFEVELMKSLDIDLDYILGLIFEHHRQAKDKEAIVAEVRRIIRSGVGNRAKEGLVADFINHTDIAAIPDKETLIEAFFTYAQGRKAEEAAQLIEAESLDPEKARRYIRLSLKHGRANDKGGDLNAILPRMSPLTPGYMEKKKSVYAKISAFVEKYKGVGGEM